jgi:hypothetical protein
MRDRGTPPLAEIASVSCSMTLGTNWEKSIPLREPSKVADEPTVSAPE